MSASTTLDIGEIRMPEFILNRLASRRLCQISDTRHKQHELEFSDLSGFDARQYKEHRLNGGIRIDLKCRWEATSVWVKMGSGANFHTFDQRQKPGLPRTTTGCVSLPGCERCFQALRSWTWTSKMCPWWRAYRGIVELWANIFGWADQCFRSVIMTHQWLMTIQFRSAILDLEEPRLSETWHLLHW